MTIMSHALQLLYAPFRVKTDTDAEEIGKREGALRC